MSHRSKEIRLCGKILDIIKSMYKSPCGFTLKRVRDMTRTYSQDKISLTFPTKIGQKRGDVLSTILFNILINDLSGQLLEAPLEL